MRLALKKIFMTTFSNNLSIQNLAEINFDNSAANVQISGYGKKIKHYAMLMIGELFILLGKNFYTAIKH